MLIQVKRGIAQVWSLLNPILSPGEFGFETDSHRIKVGDGNQHWNDLDYIPLGVADLGLENVDNTSDLDKPISLEAAAALSGKEPSITAGTTGQYWRGDKSWQTLNKLAVGLGDVDNTADASKPISTATQTALDGKSDTGHGHAQSDVTGLTAALSAKEDAANKGQPGGYASLDSGGKVPVAQLPNSIMEYQGTWDASVNSPSLADGTGNAGDVYRVIAAGSQNLGSGSISFTVGDYVIYSPVSSAWEKADTTDAVASVNGSTGVVSLTTSDISEGSNQYYTSTRVDDRIAAAVGVSVQAYDSDLTGFAGKVAPTGDVVGTTDTQTLSGKTINNPTINNYTEGVVAIGVVTSAATINLTSGTVQTATLTASTATTFTMPTATAGKSFILLLKQASSTGGGTATFTNVKWGTAGAPIISAAAGKMDILTFVCDGTSWYGSVAQGYTP